jgi:tetratricopeptide (TPR) repeat protein
LKAFPLNPYIAGNPVTDPKGFFGREEVFRDVMRMLRNPQDNAIVLYGQRRIGKTSVLLQLRRRLAGQGEFTPVYFDLQDKAAKPLAEVLYQLAYEIASVTGQPMPEINQFDDNGDYFRHVFLPAAAERAATGGLVLLFDEFDVLERRQGILENQAGQKFFPYLRTWMSELRRVKFYFVIGRRPEDLSTDVISVFSRIRASKISLLNRKDSESVVRQSEKDGSLFWTDTAFEKIWAWTQGHTYLTQLLCSVIWDRAYDNEPTTAPHVEVANVDAAIDDALKQGQNAFHWIWDGLPPAERVVMAAMAETDDTIITKDKLVEILNNSGVRLILRELELAPETLVDWGLLRQADKKGYCFVVPLLRHWVAANRPLPRVKDELDRVDEHADMLFQTAQGFYRMGKLVDAEDQLKKALERNPNHLKAMLLLGNVLFETDRIAQSGDIFEQAYKWDQTASKAYLIKALLVLADRQTIDSEQLAIYDRVLGVDPNQRIAQEGRQKIWIARGEEYLKQGKFDQAIAAFEEADDKKKAKRARENKHLHEFNIQSNTLALHKKNKDWIAAIETLKILISDFSDQGDFGKELEIAESQASLGQRYHDAIVALEKGENEKAQVLLVGIIYQEPDYMEAPRYLVKSLYGVDIGEFKPYKKVIKKVKSPLPPPTPVTDEGGGKIEEKEPIPLEPTVAPEIDTTKGDIVTNQVPPSQKPSSSFEPVIIFIRKFKNKMNSLRQQLTGSERWKNLTSPTEWQNLISKIQLQKLFKHPASWLVSSLIWLPLLVWAFWYCRSSTGELAANINFWLLIFFFIAWLVTALIGHFGKFQIEEQSFNFQGQAIKIPERVILFAVLALVAIISIIIVWGMPLLLSVVLFGVVVSMIIAWKRAGVVALIIAVIVAIGVALSIRSTMDTNARKFGLTPYIKSKNAVAQIFIKNALAGTEISELNTLSDSLHSSVLKDRNSEASDYALALSDCDSLNVLYAAERFPKIFDRDILVKVIQQLSNNDDHVSVGMATFLRRIPDSNLLEFIYPTYDSTTNMKTKRLCLFVLDGLLTHLGVDVYSDIKSFIESSTSTPRNCQRS